MLQPGPETSRPSASHASVAGEHDDRGLLFMMRTTDPAACAHVGGVHTNGRSCKLPCMADAPAPPPAMALPIEDADARREDARENARGLSSGWDEVARTRPASTSFAGNLSSEERLAQLRSCDRTASLP